MDKIYGYKQEDLIALSKEIVGKGNKTLQRIFEDFAKSHGKASGTIRNLYYALVRHAKQDQDFCEQYLGGVLPRVEKIKAFSKDDEKWLVEKVKQGINQGKSVRSIVISLANGDAKLALRYQNKYRAYLVKNPLENPRPKKENIDKNPYVSSPLPQTLFNKLKKEVNSLVDKISLKEKKENAVLRKRIAFLESENLRLSKLVYGASAESRVVDFFTSPQGSSYLH